MIDYIKSWTEKCKLPEEAYTEFAHNYKKLTQKEEDALAFSAILAEYDADMLVDFSVLIDRVRALAEKTGVHEYTAIALMYICMTPSLKKHYIAKDYPLDVFEKTSEDVSYHAQYCKAVKGFWGTFTTWHTELYQMNIFGFGRLQFQVKKADFDYCEKGYHIVKGETDLLSIHIPRNGEPMTPEACEESFRAGASFFKDRLFNGGKVLFYCSSWLLFEKHDQILKPTSNIYQFKKRFDIVEYLLYNDYSEVWRLFEKEYNGNPDELPADSSLRRSYIDMIKRGERTGRGKGVFYYE